MSYVKSQLTGGHIRQVEEFAAGTLFAPDGRPVRAVSVYTGAPGDGRPLGAISTSLDEGGPVEAVSFYDNGILFTPDGRPVEAVELLDETGAPAASLETTGLFNAAYDTPNIGLVTNELMISRWTNLNPLLAEGAWTKLAVRLGTAVPAGRKIRLYVYDAAFALIGQTAEYVTTGSDSGTIVHLDLLTPIAGPAQAAVNWLGVHVDGAVNISFSAFTAGANGSRRGTGFAYASGAPASVAALGGVQDHVVMVWAEIAVPYGVLGPWQGTAETQRDTLVFGPAADRLGAIKVPVPAGSGGTKTIDRIYARLSTITAGHKFRPVVYADTGLAGAAGVGALIAEGSEATVSATGEDLEMVINAPITEGQNYWIGVAQSGATGVKSQANGLHTFPITQFRVHPYANPAPDPAGMTNNELEVASIWARYS